MEERSPSLSREEQEELIRSNKKVKDVNHAGYHEGRDSFPSSPSHGYSPWNHATSFKDKLIGEIPGAFTQAFSFGELMEDDVESDDEVEDLRQGLVAVKFSKSFKQQIRKSWTKALIVKVYGRSFGFNYIQNRLLSLWKPARRLDCVDLEYGFYLTRFSLREDYEAILKKGPWFIGEHFLSIRPWEPDFRPETASISSIAVWIRLNNLPIEYYNAEALHHIGKSIGNVLRVDTHTASETRGRFARLCVQIDVNKPLVTAILIGKFEQPVCYEGIQKLCFGYGRMGHKQEICPYIVRHDMPRRTAENSVEGELAERAERSCDECVTEKDKAGEGTTASAPGSGHEDAMDRGYGPWVVVTRKKNGTRNLRSGGPFAAQENGQRSGSVSKSYVERGHDGSSTDSVRKAKRKLSPTRGVNGPLINEPLQRIGKGHNNRAQSKPEGSPITHASGSVGTRAGAEVTKPKTNRKESIKGKKALARLRATQILPLSAVGESETVVEPLSSNLYGQADRSDQVKEMSCRLFGDHQPGAAAMLQDTVMPLPDMGFQFKGSCSRDAEGISGKNLRESDACMKLAHGDQTQYEMVSSVAPNYVPQSASAFTGDGDGYVPTHVENVAGIRVDKGYVDTDRMELEGGSEGAAAF